MTVTNDRAIELARECGWEVMERTHNVDGGPGIYKAWIPPTPGSYAADYVVYIDTNREAFADAVIRIATNYIAEDDRFRAANGLRNSDVATLLYADRVRDVMDRTVEAFRKAESVTTRRQA